MERRNFLRSLVAAGAPLKERAESRNRRAHHVNEHLYRGPMVIPERIANIVSEHPSIKRTTDRHLVSRYAGDGDGWTWLFRCQIPESRLMVGEIVRTPEGSIRVHCWHAADPERYTAHRSPAEIVAAKGDPELPSPALPRPIMPPLMSAPANRPEAWDDDIFTSEEAAQIMRDAGYDVA